MKRNLLLFIILHITLFLSSQDNVINLSNKNNSLNNEDSESDLFHFSSRKNLPKSVLIGELGDFYSENRDWADIVNDVDSFLKAFNSINYNLIDDDYKFIYENSFKNGIFKGLILEKWFIGIPNVDDDRAYVPVELNFSDKIYTGEFYLKYMDKWLISDIQMSETEMRVFNPSSSLY